MRLEKFTEKNGKVGEYRWKVELVRKRRGSSNPIEVEKTVNYLRKLPAGNTLTELYSDSVKTTISEADEDMERAIKHVKEIAEDYQRERQNLEEMK